MSSNQIKTLNCKIGVKIHYLKVVLDLSPFFFFYSVLKIVLFLYLQRGFPPHTHPTQSSNLSEMEREKIYTWVLELSSPDTREHALLELR